MGGCPHHEFILARFLVLSLRRRSSVEHLRQGIHRCIVANLTKRDRGRRADTRFLVEQQEIRECFHGRTTVVLSQRISRLAPDEFKFVLQQSDQHRGAFSWRKRQNCVNRRGSNNRSRVLQSGGGDARGFRSLKIRESHQGIAPFFYFGRTQTLPLALDFALNRREMVASLSESHPS